MRSARQLLMAGLLISGLAQANPAELLEEYQQAGAGPFSASAGEEAWNREYPQEDGSSRSFRTCHGKDLKLAGEHIKTGKHIDPLAPSVNSKRLTDISHVRKWLRRNCSWTLGRECTPQEKGDFIQFISQQ